MQGKCSITRRLVEKIPELDPKTPLRSDLFISSDVQQLDNNISRAQMRHFTDFFWNFFNPSV
jgi:hypothetical protein